MVLVLLLPPFSLSTGTVASRAAEFGVFEWSSRSLCRGAGLAGLDAAGSKVSFCFSLAVLVLSLLRQCDPPQCFYLNDIKIHLTFPNHLGT